MSAALGAYCIHRIREAAGGPAAPLDDAFIHLQFARQLAEGHFFQYVDGQGYSSGATSFLWPVLLAPFHLLGLRDVSLLWATWALGTLAHAGVAVEAYRLSLRLAGRAAALGVAAMCLLFGGFAWFAWSGMETVALGWVLLRAARLSAAFCDGPSAESPAVSARSLVAVGLLAPLVRPEGALASVMVALALGHRRRLLALVPLLGPLVVPFLNLAFTGHAASATAQVKWMIGNPYYAGEPMIAASLANARSLITNVMDGGDWVALFLPEHASLPVLLGAVALPIAAYRRRAPAHAIFTAMVVLAAFVPCTYVTFLWNRLRYVWPFAGSWFVLVGCFARELGDLASVAWRRLTVLTPIVSFGWALVLGFRLPWTIADLANSSRAITEQQVTLGRWAKDALPAGARIGVNDTGAIAYLSGRPTFDIVGLTTEGEGRYWVAGPASRFEHYERMPPGKRPTHFIVYPRWMTCPAILGRELHEATVVDQSILGGNTMVAYEARWDLLGSGALPAVSPPGAALVDELDVADLESEREHGFEVGDGWDTDELVHTSARAGERVIADGGRNRRAQDRFGLRLPAGHDSTLVMRVASNAPTEMRVSVNDREVGVVPIVGGREWEELTLALPSSAQPSGASRSIVTVRGVPVDPTEDGDGRFASFHYWVFSTP